MGGPVPELDQWTVAVSLRETYCEIPPRSYTAACGEFSANQDLFISEAVITPRESVVHLQSIAGKADLPRGASQTQAIA
jgi:hypothetical protein